MSDHVWVSKERADLTARLFRVHAKEVEHLALQLPGDLLNDLKSQALACSGVLSYIAEQLEAGQGPAVREERREVGEGTRRKIRLFRPNKGPQ